MGIDGNISCDSALTNIMGAHEGIPKVMGPIELYENRLEEPIPPIGLLCDVGLTTIVVVGIKHVGRERMTLGIIDCATLVVTLKVEVLTIPKGMVPTHVLYFFHRISL